jgi:ElaB/YqjD/DUF883 family membrane-anchored ribosome-binding protein
MATKEASAEKLLADLRSLAHEADELLQASVGQTEDKLSEVHSRLAAAVESAKASCHRFEEKAIAGAKAADRAIREHPYESLGVVFGVGILIGLLVGRR